MLAPQTTTEDIGGYARSTRANSTYRFGQEAVCELCEETHQCFERAGLVVCRTCQHDFLPPKGLLSL